MHLKKLFIKSFFLVSLTLPISAQGANDMSWFSCKNIEEKLVSIRPIRGPEFNGRIALAEHNYDGPLIIINTQFLEALSPSAQKFFFYHECAHHELGHALLTHYLGRIDRHDDILTHPTTFRADKELDADCLAAHHLRNNGLSDSFGGNIIGLLEEIWNTRHHDVKTPINDVERARRQKALSCFNSIESYPKSVSREIRIAKSKLAYPDM